MLFDGGILENIIISNITIECKRFDWYWWGDGDPLHFNLIQRSEIDPNIDKASEAPVGKMRNIILRNIIARGVGACLIHGSRDSLLENVSIENLRLEMVSEGESLLQKSPNALTIENARHLRLKDVELVWQQPAAPAFQLGIQVNNVEDLLFDGVLAPAPPAAGATAGVEFHNMQGEEIRNSRI
jgi:hypothetical protein